MTNQKFVVVLYDGTIHEIQKEIADKIFQAPSNDTKFVRINGNAIALNSISQVTEAENYYNQHPEKKNNDPKQRYKNFSQLSQPKQTYSKERHKRRLEKMRKGFLKGVAKTNNRDSISYQELKPHQQRIYNQMSEALNSLEQGSVGKYVVGID